MPEQIQTHLANDAEVAGGIIFPHPSSVFVERNVQNPVQLVFDPPVTALIFQDLGGIAAQTGDKVVCVSKVRDQGKKRGSSNTISFAEKQSERNFQ